MHEEYKGTAEAVDNGQSKAKGERAKAKGVDIVLKRKP
jgi:hypothetical protein